MTIDVHGHVTSPELFKRFPMPPSLADIDGMIEQKAALGITTTIVGSPVGAGTMVPVPGLDNYAQPLDELERFHEWVAETVRDRPAALRAYVYVNPFGDSDELDRAAKRLRQDEFVGIIANTSVRGRYLNEERCDGLFALAVENRVPILLHPPAEPVGSSALADVGLVEHVARPCDITAGLASIIFAGWLEKYPDLMLIAPNAGGALSLLAEKLDLAQLRRGGSGGGQSPLTQPPSEQLRKLYVDTATPNRHALHAALATFGADHVLFGTDSPPLTLPLRNSLDLVAELPGPPEVRTAVFQSNARRIFGLGGAA